MRYGRILVALLMAGYGLAPQYAAAAEEAAQAESAASADAPVDSGGKGGIDFSVKAKTEPESRCFIIGSNVPSNKDQAFDVPRQTVCPFVRLPASQHSGDK